MKNLLRFVLTLGFAVVAAFAMAAPPQTVNYQGDLTNQGGTPINTSVSMTFRLYNLAAGGAALYTEVQPAVAVSNGSFNAVIGAVTPIALPFDVPYWLSVQINADAEMAPRQPLASSPYAFRASTADSVSSVTGSQISGSITTATIPVANVIGAVAGPPGPVGATGPQGATGAQGPIGVTGATGVTGSAGNTVLSGIGIPAAALGVNGNFYINTAANTIHGPKAAGAWPAGVALVGPPGPIGATGPAGPNNITGNLTMVNSTSPTLGNIVKGGSPFLHNFGTDNTFVGVNAGNFSMTGGGITASGAGALSSNSSGAQNTATGTEALLLNDLGAQNTAIGFRALFRNAGGAADSNTAVGSGALFNNTAGRENVAVGVGALFNNSTGAFNIALGNNAGQSIQTGNFNIAIANNGVFGESGAIRIGGINHTRAFLAGIRNVTPAVADALPVTIDSAGQLGTGGFNNLTLSGSLNFGNVTRQMLNLWVTGATQYAIGVQDLTFYQRTSGHFAWYDGGTHSNTILTPGVGGTTLMTLTQSPPPGGLAATTGTVRAQVFTVASDRNVKEAFAAVDGAKILAALVRMPMQSWKYRNEEKVRHIGPTAQDFRAAFGVGYDDKTIATVDADGVAMAAIQGLNAKVGEQLAVIKKQSTRLESLERELREIKAMLGVK